MKTRKRTDKIRKGRKCIVTKFYALPAVANAIANSYGHWGSWEDFIEKKKVKVRC